MSLIVVLSEMVVLLFFISLFGFIYEISDADRNRDREVADSPTPLRGKKQMSDISFSLILRLVVLFPLSSR